MRTIAAIGVLLLAGPAEAHDMKVQVRVEGGQLRALVEFDDERPAPKATVRVLNERNAVIAEGTADERGVWNIPQPPAGPYTVEAECEGHAANASVTVGEPGEAEQPAGEDVKQTSPWAKLLIGLGIIAVLFSGIWYFRRPRSSTGDDPPPNDP